jgi:glycosyltransferase involved in cell wall biosynthesis
MIGESALVAALLKAAHLINVPMVACSECRGHVGDAAFLRSLPFTTFLVRLLNRQCASINVLSPDIGAELRDLGLDPRRFVHIPNGVIVPNPHVSPPFVESGRLLFLFVGRLVPVKGVADLLRAAKIVIDRGCDIGVNIVGQGPLAPYLVNLARALKIDNRVCFHGRVEHDGMDAHYKSNHVLVLPSYHEGQGVVVIEAMGFGLPVVATQSGGPEYIVDQASGRICPVGDPEVFAQAMVEIYRLPQAQLIAMSRAAYRRVVGRYDILRVANTYLSLFQKLTNT